MVLLSARAAPFLWLSGGGRGQPGRQASDSEVLYAVPWNRAPQTPHTPHHTTPLTTPRHCHTRTTPRPCHVPLPRYPPLSTPYTGTPPRVAHFIQVHDLEHSVRPPLVPEHVFAAAQQRRGHYSVDVLQPCLIRASWQCRSSLYLGHLRRALLAPGCAIGTSHRAVQGPKGGCGAATRPGRRRRLYAVPHPGARTGTRSTARRAPTSR